MDLGEALMFTDEMVRKGFVSDGCTLAPDLGIKRYCVMHDCLLRYRGRNLMTVLECDNLFFKAICTKGVRYYPIAVIYWVGVRIGAGLRFAKHRFNKLAG